MRIPRRRLSRSRAEAILDGSSADDALGRLVADARRTPPPRGTAAGEAEAVAAFRAAASWPVDAPRGADRAAPVRAGRPVPFTVTLGRSLAVRVAAAAVATVAVGGAAVAATGTVETVGASRTSPTSTQVPTTAPSTSPTTDVTTGTTTTRQPSSSSTTTAEQARLVRLCRTWQRKHPARARSAGAVPTTDAPAWATTSPATWAPDGSSTSPWRRTDEAAASSSGRTEDGRTTDGRRAGELARAAGGADRVAQFCADLVGVPRGGSGTTSSSGTSSTTDPTDTSTRSGDGASWGTTGTRPGTRRSGWTATSTDGQG